MKIALKYGIAVTVVIAAWVALKHFLLHLQGPGAQLADVLCGPLRRLLPSTV